MSSNQGGTDHPFNQEIDLLHAKKEDNSFSSYLNMNFTESNENLLIDNDIDMLIGNDSENKAVNHKVTNSHLHNSFLNNNNGHFDGILDLPDLMTNTEHVNHHFNNFDSLLQNEHSRTTTIDDMQIEKKNFNISVSAKSNSTITGKSVDSQSKRKPIKKKSVVKEDEDHFFFNDNSVPVPMQGNSLNNELIPDLQYLHGEKNNMKTFDSMLEILPDGLELMKDMEKGNVDQSGIDQHSVFDDRSKPMKINGNMQNGEIANFWTFNVEDFLSQPSSLGSTTISAPTSQNSQSIGTGTNSIGGFGKPNLIELTKQATTRRGSVASNNGKSQTHSFKTQQVVGSLNNKNDNKLPQQCFNCKTFKTPLWRRDSDGNTLCNACGLFHKLHGTMRPLSLKSDVIRKRNTKKKEKEAATGTGGETSVNTPRSRKASVVSLANNEFVGLNGNKKDSNKTKNIITSNKQVQHPSLTRRESSSSSLSAMKNKGSVYGNLVSQSLPSQNNIPIRSRRSSVSSGSSGNSNKINIPILPKKQASISMTPNNTAMGSNVLMSTSHPNYNNGGNGAIFMSGGSFMDNSPRFTQGSVVSLSPFTGLNGIDTSFSVVSTPTEMNTPIISSNLNKITSSNTGQGNNFYNNNFISQAPSTTISNGNVLSLNGKVIQQQTTIPGRTPSQSISNGKPGNSGSYSQYSMAGPYNNSISNLNFQGNGANSNVGSTNISLLSQQLKSNGVSGDTKVNPHEVSGMYNSLYGGKAGNLQGFTGLRDVSDRFSTSQNNEAGHSGNNDDLSWLKFGL
ncbi:hypothetical protein QEN19_000915 [Hanseniaspora menglaensis]